MKKRGAVNPEAFAIYNRRDDSLYTKVSRKAEQAALRSMWAAEAKQMKKVEKLRAMLEKENEKLSTMSQARHDFCGKLRGF